MRRRLSGYLRLNRQDEVKESKYSKKKKERKNKRIGKANKD